MFKDRGDKWPKKDWVRHDEQIRLPQIMVIHDGNNLGIMQTRDALALARNLNLNLVEVSPTSRPPVCHIRDYGKFMFERSKKKKENEKKSHAPKEKEVDFRYVISDHDLETKANQIKKFLEKGIKVRCVVKFKQREKAHKHMGFELLNKLISKLKDVSSVELAPCFEGGNVVCRLDVKK